MRRNTERQLIIVSDLDDVWTYTNRHFRFHMDAALEQLILFIGLDPTIPRSRLFTVLRRTTQGD